MPFTVLLFLALGLIVLVGEALHLIRVIFTGQAFRLAKKGQHHR